MARRRLGKESRHGKIPPGWKKVGLQVPDPLMEQFQAGRSMTGDVKYIGTAALALFMSLPAHVQEDLKRFTAHATLFDADKFEPSSVYERFCHLMGIQQAEPAEPPASIPMQRIAN